MTDKLEKARQGAKKGKENHPQAQQREFQVRGHKIWVPLEHTLQYQEARIKRKTHRSLIIEKGFSLFVRRIVIYMQVNKNTSSVVIIVHLLPTNFILLFTVMCYM